MLEKYLIFHAVCAFFEVGELFFPFLSSMEFSIEHSNEKWSKALTVSVKFILAPLFTLLNLVLLLFVLYLLLSRKNKGDVKINWEWPREKKKDEK